MTPTMPEPSLLSKSKTCTLGDHPDSFSTLDVLVNTSLFPEWDLSPGSRLQIVAGKEAPDARESSQAHGAARHAEDVRKGASEPSRPDQLYQLAHAIPAKTCKKDAGGICYVFEVEDVPESLLAKHPSLEVSWHLLNLPRAPQTHPSADIVV